MKRLFFFFTMSLFCSRSNAQTCVGQPNAHLVTDYGAFVPNASDANTIATNNATINGAIVTLGQAGGGILLLPVGTFYIGPNPNLSDRAITIDYDNITICGAGVGQTILKTNGTWNVANARRGHGIIIEGTLSFDNPRKNIVLKDFELDGQSGWTGESNWPAHPVTGEGWDIYHKGIVPSWDKYTDSVTLENLYVHHYKGEILYCGGFGMGKLTVKNVKMAETNGSDFNLWGSELLVENCEFGGPSRFWIEIGARQSQNSNVSNKAIFRNNTFHDAKVDGASIVMTQGDFNPYAITFENNTITDAFGVFGVFGLYGGVGGPINIKNNNISNCSGIILGTAYTTNWINSGSNKNVTMENNTIVGGSYLAYYAGFAENFVVKNNTFEGLHSVVYAPYGPLLGNVFEGNTIINARTCEEESGIQPYTRPLFKDNIYVNCYGRVGQGTFYINAASRLITPRCEQVVVYGETPNLIASLATNNYPNGQKTAISGGSIALPVRFATGQSSYTMSTDKYLIGTDTLHFTFDAGQSKWIEDVLIAALPFVTSTAISSVTTATAVCEGNVTSGGNSSVSTRGFCWHTSFNPTIANNVTNNGTGTGTFTSAITGLSAGTTYYVRAYATNAAGTSYGNNLQFTTSSANGVNVYSLLNSQVPVGSASDQPYELGMKFTSTVVGTLTKIRYYKAVGETGVHTGRIWSNAGTPLASVVFSNETASGWQEATLATPLSITANTHYVVSVNSVTNYAFTPNGFGSVQNNGPLSSVVGLNGLFNETPSLFPTNSFNYTNYFRDVVFVDGTVLSVDLLDFQGKNHENGVLLEWTTANEKNHAYFDVQRADEGQRFQHLADVEARGKKTGRQQYTFFDAQPNDINYYRLRQVDKNGAFTFSKILTFEAKQTRVDIFPNPVQAFLSITNSRMTGAPYTIYNALGVAIQTGVLDKNGIDVQPLPSGIYFLSIKQKGYRFVKI
jgi:hypothetical protein